MRFSEEAWQRTAALRAAIHRLPFNTELAAGTLAPERFRFYILQDAIYLGEYARVLALAAAKAPDAATVQWFSGAAGEAIASNRRCTAAISRSSGRARGDRRGRAVARLSRLYQLSAQHGAPRALGGAGGGDLAVFLDLLGRSPPRSPPRRRRQNPYRAWIDTYADPRFGGAVRRSSRFADEARSSDAGRGELLCLAASAAAPVRIPVLGRRLPSARLAQFS